MSDFNEDRAYEMGDPTRTRYIQPEEEERFEVEEQSAVNHGDPKIRELEFALSELMDSFESVMEQFANYSDKEPWKNFESWQQAYGLIHAEDVPEEK
jgi:hypothetical protein